jgi:hypothetical protein
VQTGGQLPVQPAVSNLRPPSSYNNVLFHAAETQQNSPFSSIASHTITQSPVNPALCVRPAGVHVMEEFNNQCKDNSKHWLRL